MEVLVQFHIHHHHDFFIGVDSIVLVVVLTLFFSLS